MIIEMRRDGDGGLSYQENTQAEICLTVWALTGWVITGFDDWINTESHWADDRSRGKENREELIRLRHRLTKTYHKYNSDNYVIQLEAEGLYAAAMRTASHIAGYKIARKNKDRSDKAREVSKLPRPNGKSLFKKAVVAAMSGGKKDFQSFQTFMQRWRMGHINGLTAKTLDNSESYIIADENGDLGQITYAWGTLEKMYSQN